MTGVLSVANQGIRRSVVRDEGQFECGLQWATGRGPITDKKMVASRWRIVDRLASQRISKMVNSKILESKT